MASALLAATSAVISSPLMTTPARFTPLIVGNAARSNPDQLPRSNGYASSSNATILMLLDSGEYASR